MTHVQLINLESEVARSKDQRSSRFFVMPDTSRIAPDGELHTARFWKVLPASEGEPERQVNLYEGLLLADHSELETLERIHRRELSSTDQRILRFGSFIIEHLYLNVANDFRKEAPAIYANAAKLARFLVRYWSEERRSRESLAIFALPMAIRTYWRAIQRVAISAEHLWIHQPESKDGISFETAARILVDQHEMDESSWIVHWLNVDLDADTSDRGPYKLTDLKREYARALRDWQAVCLDDGNAQFFIQVLLPWLSPKHGDWQRLREDELNRTIWPDFALPNASLAQSALPQTDDWWDEMPAGERIDAIGASISSDRAALTNVLENWYLPRYDLRRAAAINVAISLGEDRFHHPNPPWWRRGWNGLRRFASSYLSWASLLGIERFLAGIGAAYLVTVFTPDIWDLLDTMVEDHRWAAITLPIALVVIPLWWLARGIRRKIGIRSPWVSLRRAFRIWLPGTFWSFIIGFFFAMTVAPAILSCPNSGPRGDPLISNWWPSFLPMPSVFEHWQLSCRIVGWSNFWIIVIYAQIAVAIGIFVQLLFDDKPTTAPLDAP